MDRLIDWNNPDVAAAPVRVGTDAKRLSVAMDNFKHGRQAPKPAPRSPVEPMIGNHAAAAHEPARPLSPGEDTSAEDFLDNNSTPRGSAAAAARHLQAQEQAARMKEQAIEAAAAAQADAEATSAATAAVQAATIESKAKVESEKAALALAEAEAAGIAAERADLERKAQEERAALEAARKQRAEAERRAIEESEAEQQQLAEKVQCLCRRHRY